MEKFNILVPNGIRYISDWSNGNYNDQYHLENYQFPHILNKTVTGCGYTEYCICNNQNLVLCSPRRMLLENKMKQHLGDLNVLYARNDLEKTVDYEKDITGNKHSQNFIDEFMSDVVKTPDPSILENIMKLKDKIRNHCLNCIQFNLPFKILVTYDSFRHVKEVLLELGLLQDTQIVIDEFQSILVDARFKSNTELELLHHLQGLSKVCFVSATPMIDEYLDMLDEFKDLPYYSFDWKTLDPNRIKSPEINIKEFYRGLGEEIEKVITKYRDGKFEKAFVVDKFGNPGEIASNEAVIFLNSVSDICSAIKKNKLTPWETNVLCARTPSNEKKVKAAFDKVLRELYPSDKTKRMSHIGDSVGTIPVKGEQHKMFTFCTRTVYLGADFYSTCARTFIFSDSNIDCLAVDVGMDLEQILGRQRLDENPWKNTANLYVKTTGHKYTKEDFDARLLVKRQKTESLLRVWNNTPDTDDKFNVAETYERDADATNYKYNYAAVNNHSGLGKVPVFNNIVYVAEIRAFRIQQGTYKNLYSVFNALQTKEISINEITPVDEFIENFNSISHFVDKMKFIEKVNKELDEIEFNLFINHLPRKFQDYVNKVGLKRCKALSYKESDIQKDWSRMVNNCSLEDELRKNIYNTFEVGKRYTKAFIKEELRKIYNAIGYKLTPKATDIEKYFNIKFVLLTNSSTGKRENGFEILNKLIND